MTTHLTPQTPAEKQLAAADPAASMDQIRLTAHAERDLARIMELPRDPAIPPRFRPSSGRARSVFTVVAAATATAATVVAVQFGTGGGVPALAATPPPLSTQHDPTRADAPAELRRIADRVAGFPDDTGTGTTAAIETRSWSLFTRVNGKQVTSEVVPAKTSKVIHADGSSEDTSVYSFGDGSTETTHGTYQDSLSWPLRGLSSDADVLAGQLDPGHEQQGRAGRFDALVTANLQMPLEPATRAAMLRYLSRTQGIATVGAVTDRIGRQGVGFTVTSSYSGLPTRYLLVVDPATGKVLDYEETLTTDPGKLNVEVPAVIGYIVWDNAEYQD